MINELAERSGAAEARGILLVRQFTHSDFAGTDCAAQGRWPASLCPNLFEEGVFIQEGKQYIVPIKEPELPVWRPAIFCMSTAQPYRIRKKFSQALNSESANRVGQAPENQSRSGRTVHQRGNLDTLKKRR